MNIHLNSKGLNKNNKQEREKYTKKDVNNEEFDDADDVLKYNDLIFEKPIKIKDSEKSVGELNIILAFLFFIKNLGKYSTHPKNNQLNKFQIYTVDAQMNYNDNIDYNENEEIEKIKKYLQTVLYMNNVKHELNQKN